MFAFSTVTPRLKSVAALLPSPIWRAQLK